MGACDGEFEHQKTARKNKKFTTNMGKTIINPPKKEEEENRIKREGKKNHLFCFRKNMERMGERYRKEDGGRRRVKIGR